MTTIIPGLKRRTLLISLFIAGSSSVHINKAFGQTGGKFNIAAVIDQLPRSLESDFAKAGAESAIRAVYNFRRTMAPAGYERSPEWEKGYTQAHAAFQKYLWEGSLSEARAVTLRDKDTLSTLEDSYQKNARNFQNFRQAVAQQSAPIYLRVASGDLLLRAQLFFAAVLRGAGPDTFKQAASISAVWPFCP